MTTLDKIGVKHGTDKSSLNHNYLNFYEKLFKGFLPARPYILEIGIQFGNSLKTWREYWPDAVIVGIDSINNKFTEPSITMFFGDAYSEEMIKITGHRSYDIIIDDGDHDPKHQAFVVKEYSKLLYDSGLLIIEDVSEQADLHPPNPGFQSVTVKMNEGHSTAASRLFITWKK